MNNRVVFLVLCICLSCGCSDEGGSNLQRAIELNQRAFVFDAHCDSALNIVEYGADLGQRLDFGHLDIPRMNEGGLKAQVFAAWTAPEFWPDKASERAWVLLDAVESFVLEYPQKIGIALTAADADALSREGKISVFLGIEGGHAIEDSLDSLREFYDGGVRLMTLTWMYNNNWADASGDTPVHGGLTEFGVEVVKEMNRLGMVVDVSHASDETFYDTLEVTDKPVVASHSCVRTLHDHHRNLSDDMLVALAQNGGVIGINFFPEYLAPQGTEVTVKTLVDHIEYAVDVAGLDHVGIGSDFDGVPTLPKGLQDVSSLPAVTEELLDRGFSETDIEKILGGNMLRVFRTALGG